MRYRPPIPATIDALDVAWQEHAACASEDPALFFISDRGEEPPGHKAIRERRAKAICWECPVRAICLEWALDVGDGWAILGGNTPEQRKEIRRRRRDRARRKAS